MKKMKLRDAIEIVLSNEQQLAHDITQKSYWDNHKNMKK